MGEMRAKRRVVNASEESTYLLGTVVAVERERKRERGKGIGKVKRRKVDVGKGGEGMQKLDVTGAKSNTRE